MKATTKRFGMKPNNRTMVIALGIMDVAKVSKESVSDIVERMLTEQLFGVHPIAQRTVRSLYTNKGETVRSLLPHAILDIKLTGVPQATESFAALMAALARIHGAKLQGMCESYARAKLLSTINEITCNAKKPEGTKFLGGKPVSHVEDRARNAIAELERGGHDQVVEALDFIADYWGLIAPTAAAEALASTAAALAPWEETTHDRAFFSDAVNTAWADVDDELIHKEVMHSGLEDIEDEDDLDLINDRLALKDLGDSGIW